MRPSSGVSRSALARAITAMGMAAPCLAAPALAHAAEAAKVSNPVTLSEIVVTAAKREQSLLQVPAAVTALTAQLRDQTGITSPQQQLNFSPGVTYNPSVDRVTIRGVGRLTTNLGTDPGVAVYQDGFYVGSVAGPGGGIGNSTLLTDRVEILRGPQGTLYGRNSVGGAVNAITKRPSDVFGGEARLSVNSYAGVTEEARVTGSIVPTLSGSFAFRRVDQENGWYKNKAVGGGPDEGGPPNGPEHSWGIDAQLKWKPTENFNAWIRYTTQASETRPRSYTGITAYGVPARGDGVPYVFEGLPADGNPGVTDHRAFRTDIPTIDKLKDYHQVIGELVYHFDNVDLKYTGGYRRYNDLLTFDGNAVDNQNFQFPYDCVTLLGQNANRVGDLNKIEDCDLTQPGVQRQYATIHNNTFDYMTDDRIEFSHELNLSSTGSGRLQYIVGLYYFQGHDRQDLNITALNEPGNNIITVPGSNAPNPTTDKSLIYGYKSALQTISRAVYGQLDYAVTDQFKVTLGLRGSMDSKTGHEENDYVYWLVTGIPKGGPLAIAPGVVIPSPVFIPVPLVGGFCIPGPQVPGVPPFYELDPPYTCPIGRDMSRTFKAMTGEAGLQWTPSKDTNVYGRYSRGFKSGGFNLGWALADPFVGSEYLDAFEVGWKQNYGQFQFNSAAFYYKYKDMQAVDSKIQNSIVLPKLINLPKVNTYGFELEATWTPIEHLTLLANYSYLHTEIKEACCYSDASDPLAKQPGAQPVGPLDVGTDRDLQPQSLVGKQLANSPNHKFALNATYTIPDVLGGDIITSATFNYIGQSYQTLFNTNLDTIKAGNTTDLRITWQSHKNGLQLILTASNLFDQELQTGFITLPPQNLSFQSLYLAPPRIVTLEARYAF